MRKHATTTLPLLSALIVCAAPAAAQERDARVTPFGTIRLEAAGIHTTWSARFGTPSGDDTARTPLGADVRVRLGPENVPALAALEGSLNEVFAATDTVDAAPGFRAGPQDVVLGESELAYAVDRVVAPMAVEVGVLPRVSVRIGTSVVQHTASVRRYGFAGGLVGVNPDAAHNREVLGRIDAALEAVGSGAWLPTAGSPAGGALQARVRAVLPDDSLRLPQRAPTAAELAQGLAGTALAVPQLGRAADEWQLGDAELGVRVQFLDNVRQPLPEARGVALRAALGVAARLPLIEPAVVESPLLPRPAHGYGALAAHFDADVFAGRWLWTTASVALERRQPATFTRPVLDANRFLEPLAARTFEHAPGDLLELAVHPRVRFAEALAAGVRYSVSRLGAERWSEQAGDGGEAAEVEIAARSTQRIGLALRYSTLPAVARGAAVLPLEAHIGWTTTLGGAGGEPAASVVEMRGVVFHRLWGR